jgi:hypothetical protein
MRNSLLVVIFGLTIIVSPTASRGQVPLWEHTWGGANDDLARACAVGPTGNIYVAGWTGNIGSAGDVLLAKYTDEGSLVWVKSWDFGTLELAFDIAVDEDGNVILAGLTEFGAYSDDALIMKIDSSGTVLWTRTWSTGWDAAEDIDVDNNGNIFVSGPTGPGSSSQDAFVSKYDSDGNLLWTRSWDRGGYEAPHGQALDPSGSVYITGLASAGLGGPMDVFLMKIDESGNLGWGRIWSMSGTERSVDLTRSGEVRAKMWGGLFVRVWTATSISLAILGVSGQEIVILSYSPTIARAICCFSKLGALQEMTRDMVYASVHRVPCTSLVSDPMQTAHGKT